MRKLIATIAAGVALAGVSLASTSVLATGSWGLLCICRRASDQLWVVVPDAVDAHRRERRRSKLALGRIQQLPFEVGHL
jgi:hypothetical protein